MACPIGNRRNHCSFYRLFGKRGDDDLNHAAFFAALRRRDSGVFGTSLSQRQVDGINGILSAFETHGDGHRSTLAYALATAYHETGGRMVPVREGFASTDAGARRAVNRLAAQRGPNSAVAKYAQPQPPHGHVYYGRGHVQLTWKDNYARSSADAGVDLVANPDAMLDPVISARVLIKGLIDGRWNGQGHGVHHYLGQGDWIGARRTVNILDKAEQIAAYAHAFDSALREAGYQVAPRTSPRPVPRPALSTNSVDDSQTGIGYNQSQRPPPVPRSGILWAIARLFGKG